MKYFSLFTGIGGFELGIEQAYVEKSNRTKNRGSKATAKDRGKSTKAQVVGTTRRQSGKHNHNARSRQEQTHCVGYSEIDRYAIKTYESHFPHHKNYGDITKIKTEDLPEFDLLVGGFPCQSFSIAGRRQGFEDTRGTLFFEIARILSAKKPRFFLLENVKGLLSHDGGRTFKTIIASLDGMGYDLQWQVLNSADFGVAQSRERIYIIGYLRGKTRPEVFPFTGGDQKSIGKADKQGRANTLTGSSAGGQNRWGNYIHQINNPKHSNDRIYSPDGVSPTLNTMQGGMRQPFVKDKMVIRRLTPIECERLQGFPDDWTAGVSDTQRYKMIGNAVTVDVIRAIMMRL